MGFFSGLSRDFSGLQNIVFFLDFAAFIYYGVKLAPTPSHFSVYLAQGERYV
jgi:hypothetical protein